MTKAVQMLLKKKKTETSYAQLNNSTGTESDSKF